MTTAIELLQAVGALLAGVVARLGISLVLGLVLVLPALALGALIHLARRRRDRDLRRTGGIAWRPGAWHAPNHTWLAPRRPGELAVGIDDLAARILPSVTSVELPAPGMVVHKGDPIAILRAGNRLVRVGAPADGMVVKANGAARSDPGVVKREPCGAGWLFTLAPASKAYRALPRDAEAARWMEAERARLDRFLERELGLAAADGGTLLMPPAAALDDEGFEKLVSAFLHAA